MGRPRNVTQKSGLYPEVLQALAIPFVLLARREGASSDPIVDDVAVEAESG